jgi:hypothetical protein
MECCLHSKSLHAPLSERVDDDGEVTIEAQ